MVIAVLSSPDAASTGFFVGPDVGFAVGVMERSAFPEGVASGVGVSVGNSNSVGLGSTVKDFVSVFGSKKYLADTYPTPAKTNKIRNMKINFLDLRGDALCLAWPS